MGRKAFSVLFILLAFALLGMLGCGGGGGGGIGKVAGMVFAPDGVTPVADAYVYVPIGGVRGVDRQPPEDAITWTTSGADGAFLLEDVPAGIATVRISKGAWFKEFEADVNADQTTEATAADTTLPDTGPGVPNIAVVTGWYDRMEDVLAKLGLGDVDANGMLVPGTEQFDLYDGNGSLLDLPDPAGYPNFDALVTDVGVMEQYDIIFINCGNAYEYLLFPALAAAGQGKQAAPTVVDNLRDYVWAGGSLYVTDLSYDFVEQAFQEAIDFYGSDATPVNEPEISGEAEVGDSSVVNDATVLDATLRSWLDGLNALNPDETVHIEGFLSGWAVMNAINPDPLLGVKAWVQSNEFYFPTLGLSARTEHSGAGGRGRVAPAGVPLTVSFPHNEGRVLYSSYHTEETPDPSLRPQERILAYLVFEVS